MDGSATHDIIKFHDTTKLLNNEPALGLGRCRIIVALANVVFYGASKTHIYPVYFWVLFDDHEAITTLSRWRVALRVDNGRSSRKALPWAVALATRSAGSAIIVAAGLGSETRSQDTRPLQRSFLKFRSIRQVETAAAALRLGAAARRYHRCCRSLWYTLALFSCVLYFPRHACSFGFWIVVARAAGHASTAENLPFPSLLGHQVITPSGSAFASGALWVSVLFNCAPSPEVHFVCRSAAFRVFCTASSLYRSLADFLQRRAPPLPTFERQKSPCQRCGRTRFTL